MNSLKYLCLSAVCLALASDAALAQWPSYRPPFRSHESRYRFDRDHDHHYRHRRPRDEDVPVRELHPRQVESVIRSYYQRYLERLPDAPGLRGWINHAYRSGSLREVQVAILSSVEYFLQSYNNPQVFVQFLFQDVLGRQPSQWELNYWVSRYHEAFGGDREEFVREFLARMDR